MPIKGQPKSTTNIPPKKHKVPLILCLWKKNLNVLSNPMTHASPAIKRICGHKTGSCVNEYYDNEQY